MLRPGQVIIVCVLALLSIGVVMVNSAEMSVRPDAPGGDADILFRTLITSRPVVYLGLALAGLTLCSLVPVGRLADLLGAGRDDDAPIDRPERTIDVVVLGVGVALLLGVVSLAYVPALAREVNGSARWITIPGVPLQSIQPSEIAKWGLVLLLAWYGARRAATMPRVLTGLAPALAAGAVVAGLVALEDLGTGVLIGTVACIVLVAAGARLWPFFAAAPVAGLALAGLILANPYRMERVTAFLHPYADPQGSGYHMIQSMAAIAGGQGAGRGLGHGLQKFGYLPEDQTDFVFAVIGEELGIAGAGMVIALYLVLVWACLAIVREERRPALQLAGLGVTATVGLQALMNLVVVTGLAPTKGIALPLVSAGGTGWLLTSAALGLLVAMDRAHAREASEAPDEPERLVDLEDLDVEMEEEPPLVFTGPGVGAPVAR